MEKDFYTKQQRLHMDFLQQVKSHDLQDFQGKMVYMQLYSQLIDPNYSPRKELSDIDVAVKLSTIREKVLGQLAAA